MSRFLLAVAFLSTSLLGQAPVTAAQISPNCPPGQSPQFVFGFADLRAQVGDAMGDPVECEHANPENGDTLQQTTTGLSFYRKSSNIPTFTNGSDHWGLTTDGLVYWTGSSIDPPGVVPPPAAQPAVAPTPVPRPVAFSEADIAARVAPSVVQVLTADGAGSGVSVAGGVLTNEHVVRGASRVDLFTSDGRRFGATVRSTDLTRDLALLVPDLSLPTVDTEAAGQQRQGDQLLVLGYPRPSILGIGGQASVTRGLLSAIRQDNGVTLVQTDASVNPGNSGGPVLNMRGNVIGIVSFGLKESTGLNFAIATESIQAFLAAPPAIARPPSTPTPTPPPGAQPSPTLTPVLAEPMFKGSPRDIVVQPSDLGPGWGIVSQDQNDANPYSGGPLLTSFRQGSKQGAPYLFTWVEVYYRIETAQQAVHNDNSPPGRAPDLCDDGSMARNDDGTVLIQCRVKNVELTVNWGPYDFSVGVLKIMAARVNALAR